MSENKWEPETYHDMGPGDLHDLYPGQDLGVGPPEGAAEPEAEAGG